MDILSLAIILLLSFVCQGVYSRKSGDVPQFKDYHPNLIAQVGATVTINCPLEKFEKDFYISWEKDGVQIELLSFDNIEPTKKSLRITNITLDNTGMYSCVATNGNGRNVASINVTVTEHLRLSPAEDLLDQMNKVPIGIASSERKLITGRPPSFIRFSPGRRDPIRRDIGNSLNLDCRARGIPKPEIIWMKDGLKIDNRRPMLSIEKLSRREAGNYTCIISNVFGNTSRAFEVEINSPTFTVSPFDECSTRKPVIQEISQNVTVTVGSNVTIYCTVLHCRHPILNWFPPSHDKTDTGDGPIQWRPLSIHGSRPRMESEYFSDGRYRLSVYLTDLTKEEMGTYGCGVSDPMTSRGDIKFVTLKLYGDTDQSEVDPPENKRKSDNIFTRFQAMIIVGCTVLGVVVFALGVCVVYSVRKSARRTRQSKYSSTRRAVPADYVIVHQDSAPFKSASSSPAYGNYYEKKQLPSSIFVPNSVHHSDNGQIPVHLLHERIATVMPESATEYEEVIDDMSSYDYFRVRHPPSMVSSYAYSGPLARN